MQPLQIAGPSPPQQLGSSFAVEGPTCLENAQRVLLRVPYKPPVPVVGSREIGDVQRLIARARRLCDTLIPPPGLVAGVTKPSRVHKNERSRLLSPSACVVLPEPA